MKFEAPGSKHLKLEYDELLSSFAFIFNLRRHILGSALAAAMDLLTASVTG